MTLLPAKELGIGEEVRAALLGAASRLSRSNTEMYLDLVQDAAVYIILFVDSYRTSDETGTPPDVVLENHGVSNALLYTSIRNRMIDSVRSKRYNYSHANKNQRIGITDEDGENQVPSAEYVVHGHRGDVTRYETKWNSHNVTLCVESGEDETVDRATADMLLASLDDDVRTLVELCLCSGFSQQFTGDLLHICRSSVGKTVRRAVQTIRDDIERTDDEEGREGSKVRGEGPLLQDADS